jgi:hypothetical protein
MLSYRLCSHPHPRPSSQVSFLRYRTLVTLGATGLPSHRIHYRSRRPCRHYYYYDVSRPDIPRQLYHVLYRHCGAEHYHVWLSRWHTRHH